MERPKAPCAPAIDEPASPLCGRDMIPTHIGDCGFRRERAPRGRACLEMRAAGGGRSSAMWRGTMIGVGQIKLPIALPAVDWELRRQGGEGHQRWLELMAVCGAREVTERGTGCGLPHFIP
jgi:hypothetical protein